MFYHVAKGNKEKNEDTPKRRRRTHNNNTEDSKGFNTNEDFNTFSDMEPGLWGQSINRDHRARSKSPRPHSASRSRSRVRDSGVEGREGEDPEQHYENDSYRAEDGREGDDRECDDDDFIYVPKCMLGQPLKDFDSGQENVSVFVYKVSFFYLLTVLLDIYLISIHNTSIALFP